jgi:hypothetical protein
MSRSVGRALVTLIVMFAIAASASSAEAGKRKKKAAKKAAPAVMNAEQEKALGAFMGPFKFGMTKEDIIKVVSKQVRERYAEKIAATNDVYKQDKLRRKRDKTIKTFASSFYAFKGKKGGWDVSIIDDQFRHNTDESMMVQWETHEGRDQRRFFFFFEGKLYKMFIALNTSAIAGAEERGFDYFRELMQGRFGKGTDVNGSVQWTSKTIRAQAINKTGLYSAFCLAFADLATERELEKVRVANAPPAEKKNNIIEAVKDDGEDPDISAGANTIDNMVKRGN